MPSDTKPTFSHLVCGAPSVQTAFVSHPPTRFWWVLILRLHGKPVSSLLSTAEAVQRIADGFKFYACLYRCVAVIFLALSPAFIAFNITESPAASFYWAGASGLTGLYLWGVSGLGYSGAKSYASGHEQGVRLLLAFMVMVIAFLSMFVAVASLVAHQLTGLSVLPNLLVASGLFAFGVGSYMIEIVYLATERPS